MAEKKVSSWLDTSKPTPDFPALTSDELLDVWAMNRNNGTGRMAAEEYMKRQYVLRMGQLSQRLTRDPSEM